jgi:argininosuccinate lyase
MKGVPFRDAHSIIGRIVLYCIDRQCSIDELKLSELKEFDDHFEEDIFDAVSLETCVEKRLTIGAPGTDAMNKVISQNESYIKMNEVEGGERQ